MKDHDPFQMSIRDKLFGMIASVFKRHGAASINTPVFESKVRDHFLFIEKLK